jgi:hypothetical protein
MSTRGCVGVYTKGKAWRGVYNHSDSYPTGLGQEVFDHLKKVDLKEFAKNILTYSDWREYQNGGVCEYCGKKGVGQPCNISGVIYGFSLLNRDAIIKMRQQQGVPVDKINKELAQFDKIERLRKETGYPDPEAEHHSHSSEKASVESKNAKFDALFIEWAYIVNAEKRTLDVYSHARAKGEHTKKADNGNTWKSPNYCYILVDSISLDDPKEPNWEDIEAMGDRISDAAYRKHEKPSKIKVIDKFLAS